MARVRGPLFGIGASGKLADAIVYSHWKGRPYVRRYVIPSNPRSAAQTGVRGNIICLNNIWDKLDPTTRGTWEEYAAEYSISTWNGYVKYNQLRFSGFRAPVNDLLFEGTGVASDEPTTLAAAVEGSDIALTWDADTGGAKSGYWIARSTITGFTPGKTTLIAGTHTSVPEYRDCSLDDGTYYYRVAAFNFGGIPTAWCAEISGTVT